MNDPFRLVGIRPIPQKVSQKARSGISGKPFFSGLLLSLIVLGCLFCPLFASKDPSYLDLAHYSAPPDGEFLFGTDTMGRDIFAMVWYGGRLSLLIGFASTVISTAIAIVFGTVSGCGPRWLDGLFMRFTDLFLSVPSLLTVILMQAALGKANAFTISFVLGLTSWTGIAKVVRTEVRQLRNSEYVLAARAMGGGFFYILRRHLAPNFLPSILFIVVMNIRGAIVAESTLSFMGIGLPVETVSWGSMLSLAEKALLTNAWWIILIPGAFLTVTLLCVTNLGNYLRKKGNPGQSNL